MSDDECEEMCRKVHAKWCEYKTKLSQEMFSLDHFLEDIFFAGYETRLNEEAQNEK